MTAFQRASTTAISAAGVDLPLAGTSPEGLPFRNFDVFATPHWNTLVKDGMNDIDTRCDAYLAWYDSRKRSQQAADQPDQHDCPVGRIAISASATNCLLRLMLIGVVASNT